MAVTLFTSIMKADILGKTVSERHVVVRDALVEAGLLGSRSGGRRLRALSAARHRNRLLRIFPAGGSLATAPAQQNQFFGHHFSDVDLLAFFVLVIAGLFVMILKNGVRIVTLTLLASYVNPAFLYGRLHNEGGVVFFLLGLLLMLPVLLLLQRSERKAPSPVPT